MSDIKMKWTVEQIVEQYLLNQQLNSDANDERDTDGMRETFETMREIEEVCRIRGIDLEAAIDESRTPRAEVECPDCGFPVYASGCPSCHPGDYGN